MKHFLSHAAYLFGAVLCMVLNITSSVSAAPLTSDSLASRLMYQVWSFPQEKVYVMTDRDAYTSGDTVRFRAFLVDAATHAKPKQSSAFVYVELQDPFGKNVARVKIRPIDGLYAGILPIDPEMGEGNYTLCAYTQFMQNSGNEYFFRKSLPVFNQLSKKYRLETRIAGGILNASLIEKSTGRPVRAEYILVNGPNQDSPLDEVKKRSSYSKKISKEWRDAGVIKIRFDKYEKFVPLPPDNSSLSLTFHPEGGYLIPDTECKLAFKALQNNGLSAEIEGFIVDDSGTTITNISTAHNGMGVTDFTPQSGHSYRAIVNGLEFPVPQANADATVIGISSLSSDSVEIAIEGKIRNDLSLIAHNGGIVSLAIGIKDKKVMLDRNSLGSGIVQFLLLDTNGNTLSSRMIFNHTGYVYSVSLEDLPSGDYAVKAVRNLRPHSQLSIVSDLLLQSELKGYVEDSDYYFRKRDKATDSHLDLLMLTHGWERYDIPSSLQGRYSIPETPIEIGGEITGVVKSRWKSKPIYDAIVMMIAPQLDYASKVFTDHDGKFVFKGLDWPDGTSFIIQAFGETGNKEHNFTVDYDTFPQYGSIATPASFVPSDALADESALTAGSIMLDELEVNALPTGEDARNALLEAMGVKTITADDIAKMQATSYEEVLRKIPGLRVVNGNVLSTNAHRMHSRGFVGSEVEYWVDGFRWTPTYSTPSGRQIVDDDMIGDGLGSAQRSYFKSMSNTLSEFSATYPIHTMKSIQYLRGDASLIMSMTAAYRGGALVFTSKSGKDLKEIHSDLFIREFSPLGYQSKPESYQPHFIYDPTSDDAVFNAAWLPMVNNVDEIPVQEGTSVQIEGIADGFIPVLIRTN